MSKTKTPAVRAFLSGGCRIGGEVAKYPSMLQAHLGYRTDTFTFAALAGESRVVNFTDRAGEPGKTIPAMHPLPPLARS